MNPRIAASVERPEDERLHWSKNLAYGMQHVLSMYGGIIAPPLIVGTAAGLTGAEVGVLIASCLFVGGLATMLQTLGVPFFGSRLPLVQGTSFASVATLVAILNGGGGMPSVFGAVLAAALAGLLVAPFFARIIRFFPPVVTGVVITTIGISLVPVAARWAMGGVESAPDYGSVANIALAAATLLIALVLSRIQAFGIARLAILIALVLGTVIALIVGKADFSAVGDGPLIALPQPFAFGLPVFELSGIVSMFIVVLVILTETTADMLAVGQITGSRVDSRRIADGLRADMLSSALAPIFNTFTQSAFAQNVGLVAITGVTSRFVVATGGGILVVLGLLPVLGRVVAELPTAVLGGVGVLLFGTVAASGIRSLSRVDYTKSGNLVIIAASLAIGCIPVVAPTFFDAFPTWFSTIFHSGISAAAITAVLLNILFNELRFTRAGRSESLAK